MKFLVALAVFGFLGAGFAQSLPIQWTESINAYLRDDEIHPPPEHGILFVGSSIIRLWSTLEQDMAPLPVYNRGFGGARSDEVLHYMDRIVLPYKPSIIVYYAGGNDVDAGVDAKTIANNFKTFTERVDEDLPQTRIFYVAVNRAPQKRARWKVVDELNARVREYVRDKEKLTYVESNAEFVDSSGNPRMELYIYDELHFSPLGYAELSKIIRPVIERAYGELPF